MTYKFTNSAEKAIEIANDTAIHILYGLTKEGTGVAAKVLENQNITADAVYDDILELIGKEAGDITETVRFYAKN